MAAKTLWIMGLSAAGKTTLATAIVNNIPEFYSPVILDGDTVRNGLNSDLGFDISDRDENIRRTSEIASILNKQNKNVIVSMITPTNKQQTLARETIGEESFYLIYLNTPLETCETRDPKGLYAKVRRGIIKNFTGISSVFERPNPEKCFLKINTQDYTVAQCCELIKAKLLNTKAV